MKSKRKWLAGILSVVMTMTVTPAYAFAGETAKGDGGADAVWTVKEENGNGQVVGNYNDLQDAINNTDMDYMIILNRDASGKGLYVGEEDDSLYLQFDFKGHTYTITEGAEKENGTTEPYAIGDYSSGTWSFDNGTLKIENCRGGINADRVRMKNFNIDASSSVECKNALYIRGSFDIGGNSSVKVQPGSDALNYYKGSGKDNVINTKGVIQGDISFFGESNNKDKLSRVLVRNGRFDGKFKNTRSVISGEEFSHLKLYGGSFTEQPDKVYIAKGYAIRATDDGRYTIGTTEALLQKIADLREEIADTTDSLDADMDVANSKIYDVGEKVDAAEESLNEGVYDDGVEKATLKAERSIQDAKAQLVDVQLYIAQKGKEYGNKGEMLKERCAILKKDLQEIDNSQYDFGDFDVDSGVENMTSSAQMMMTIFGSADEDESRGYYLVEVNELNKRLASVEKKLDKVKKLPNKVNEETSAALEETRKELEETKKALAETEKKKEELNKKLDTLIEDLQKTWEQLEKVEEELKKQNNTPTPSSTATPIKKPGQVKGLKLKAGKKKVTVTYKKVSGATSYKVTYSTNKKFKKAKTVTVKSGKTVKKTISKLKSKKTYYVKVCAIKKVKSKNFTGKWSGVKRVKVK